MVSAGIIAAGEPAAVLAGTRRFTVEEYLAMEVAGILHEDDRIELIDGVIIVMPPIGDPHEVSTDWLTRLLVPPLIDRAIVRVQGGNPPEQPQRPPTRHCPVAGAPFERSRALLPTRCVPGHRGCRQFAVLRPRREAGAVRRRWRPRGVGCEPARAR